MLAFGSLWNIVPPLLAPVTHPTTKYIIPDGPGWWLVVRQGNLFMVVVGSGVEHTYCYLE